MSSSVIALIKELDIYQSTLYPPESNHCTGLNPLNNDNLILMVARDKHGAAVGCGAVLLQAEQQGELKRVFVKPSQQGRGVAAQVINALEEAALSASCCIIRLETGIKQLEAIRLYEKQGYQRCPHFPPYMADPLSIFMQKALC